MYILVCFRSIRRVGRDTSLWLDRWFTFKDYKPKIKHNRQSLLWHNWSSVVKQVIQVEMESYACIFYTLTKGV